MTHKKVAYIMIGASGSGKSTVKQKLIEHLESVGVSVSVFSLDDCRLSFLSTSDQQIPDTDIDAYRKAFEYANDNKKEFDTHVNSAWAKALTQEAVIVDNTNLTRKSRARWIAETKQKDFIVFAIQVMCPLQTIIDRQRTRTDKSVPEETIRDMYMRQQEVLVGSEVDILKVVDGSAPVTTWRNM